MDVNFGNTFQKRYNFVLCKTKPNFLINKEPNEIRRNKGRAIRYLERGRAERNMKKKLLPQKSKKQFVENEYR